MASPKIARGNTARQANKALRRERILDEAKGLIASKGFDAFTLSELASKAEVTIPTIHNLFGKKIDIFEELCSEMVVRVDEVMSHPDINDPIAAAESFIDNLLTLFRDDEAFYRSAFVAGERIGLFRQDLPGGIFGKSMDIAVQLCKSAVSDGFLEGDVNSQLMATQVFSCQRLARHDWMNGYIDLEQYRTKVLVGIYLAYMADATPDFRKRLQQLINNLQ